MEKKKSINLAELNQLLNSNGVTVIDVRSEEEYKEKHIPGAINIPVESIESELPGIDLRKVIITACGKGGGRSERAAKQIRENHSSEVYFLEGGTFGWFENDKLD
jgi:rhodanese-related sulfurtransferase